MKKNKGFTLIELLVVIAIIGILSSVVLASLSSARNKGKDAAVKSQLASMKAQAELFYSTGETYTGICSTTAGTGLADLLIATKSSVGMDTGTTQIALTDVGAYNKITCHVLADGTAWAVEAPLTDSTSTLADMYCVDSTGVSKQENAASPVVNTLAASDVTCL